MNSPTPPDLKVLQQRLHELTGEPYSIRSCSRATSGFANATWLLDSTPLPLVVKVQSSPSVVHERDPDLEPTILNGLAASPVPVPRVVTRDPEGGVFGMPWFAMTKVDGRSLPDHPETSYADDGWFAETDAEYRTRVWEGFVDALGDLHQAPTECFGPSPRGGSHSEVLDYLDESLQAGADDRPVPRQERILEWLRDRAPDDADALATPCMADARMANLMERDGRIVALLDWELAWIGNPCGDIGYHLHLDERYAAVAGRRLSGLPDRETTWARWQARTGYEAHDRRYWEIFGGTVMAITATRAMVPLQQSGLISADVDIETVNGFVVDLIATIDA